MTRFYAGYLVGFPNYVALHDERLPGAIRKGLLGICYGNELPALMGRIEEYAVMGDPQFNDGLQAGTEDGERFFMAVEGNENPYDEATSISLEHAVLTKKIDFKSTL